LKRGDTSAIRSFIAAVFILFPQCEFSEKCESD